MSIHQRQLRSYSKLHLHDDKLGSKRELCILKAIFDRPGHVTSFISRLPTSSATELFVTPLIIMLTLHVPKTVRHGEEDHRGESPSSPPVTPLSSPFCKEEHRKSAGDRSCVALRTLNSPNSFRYVATPRASLGFHEHDSRKILDDELMEKLRDQRSNNSQRQPSFSRPKLQRSRYSFSRRVKHFRRRVYCVLSSPDGHLKSIQKLVLTGILLFEIFYIPFALSYLLEVEDVEYLTTAWKINVVVEILLVTDLLLNFNSSIHKPSRNTSHTSRSEIIRQYLTGSLIADLLGSLPAECICFFLGDSRSLLHVSLPVYIICHILRFLRFWQLPALCKSIWLQKFMKMVKVKVERWFGSFQPVLFTVLRLAAGILVIAHYLTCFLRGFRLSSGSYPFTQQIYLSALYTKHLRQVMVGMFGSINESESGIDDGYCIFLIMIGLMTMAFVFCSIFIAVANLQTSHMKITRELKSSMEKLKLPNELRDRIQRYHDHMWSEYAAMDGDILGFTRKLTQPLALEVLVHRYSDLVSGLDFWSESSPELMSALLLSVEARVFGPNDIILRQGEVDKDLFMMYHGFVELTGAEKEVLRLTQGSTFGELALLVDYNRATCVRAITYVESCVLGRQAFYRVLDRYPENRIRVVERVLAAGLRSSEFPELWARAKTLFHERLSGETALSDAEETQLSSKTAARILVQAMKLDRGPGILTPACTVLHSYVSRTNNEPTPADTQILPVLTALSKSIRRMEDDIILVKELVNDKLEKRESGLNDVAIEMTLPLQSRSSVYYESTAPNSSTTEPSGIKPPKPTTFIAKVQPKPSRFRRAATVSSLLDAARQIKHRSNVTVGDTALEHGEAYSSPQNASKRTLQRRMSKW